MPAQTPLPGDGSWRDADRPVTARFQLVTDHDGTWSREGAPDPPFWTGGGPSALIS
jgi:hypothetical protein